MHNHNADEFLIYISKNEKELKRAVRKNITFDRELFDDIFQSSIIKVYDSIVSRNVYVKDFKNYFFLSFKFNYINEQNKHRRYQERKLDLEDYKECTAHQFITDDLNADSDDETLTPDERIADLRKVLSDNFGATKANIFLDYRLSKFDGGTTYEKLADEYSVTVDIVRNAVKSINQFLSFETDDKYSIKCDALF